MNSGYTLPSLVLAGMAFAIRSTALGVERLAFQVLLTNGTFKALRVIVIVKRLHPAISGLDREVTTDALRGEQLVPVLFAVRQAILQEKTIVTESVLTIATSETLRVPLLAQCH